jgi:cation:H+ antiporter
MLIDCSILASTTANPYDAAWTFPLIILAALLISWAAESAQFLISQGTALAALALIQTLPEYSVEAVLAWAAGTDSNQIQYMTANFTGATRLLIGLGWPMIFIVASIASKAKHGRFLESIELENEHSVEVLSFLVPVLYLVLICVKGTISLLDGVVLVAIYGGVVYLLSLAPPEEAEKIDDMDAIPRWILRRRPELRGNLIIFLFLAGGAMIFFCAHPFVESCKSLGLAIGITPYIMLQWIAPILSEFPEKVSAFNWARKVRTAPMAFMNMASSALQEVTLLVAVMPVVFYLSSFRHGLPVGPIPLSHFQRVEILLTASQAFLGMVLLLDLRVRAYEAIGLLALWVLQILAGAMHGANEDMTHASTRIHWYLTWISFGWAAIELCLYAFSANRLRAAGALRQLLQDHRKHREGPPNDSPEPPQY